jgi:membrane glycosyltransferase
MDGLSPLHPANSALPDAWRALPDEAPLRMPVQSLRRVAASGPRERPSGPKGIWLRRLLVIGGAILLTALAAREMALVLDIARPTVVQAILLGIFCILFAWIALAFVSALVGFACMLRHERGTLGISAAGPLPRLATRTALLVPIHREPPQRVMAGIQAIHESLDAIGALDSFHFFILSDTPDADGWVDEEAAFLALRERTGDSERIFYRRRPKNVGRKAGNIAEWVTRFGAAYPQMLILDADSVMEGSALVRLAGAMERHPDVGLIQTLPAIVGGKSLFALLQQFASRVYGPMIAAGIAWWHGAESNYWGHNAIIRTRAFADHAGLPTLAGPRPFGGHIMSHDFVEAALLRRAGWAVHLVPSLPGSYEESPPSLMDVAIRDRRWCQGNLQHAAVLTAKGLHPISRLHLLSGIGSYITAPLWFLFIIVGVLAALETHFVRPTYFADQRSLFPDWPVVDPVRAMWLFIVTMALLLVPKLLAWIVAMRSPAERRGLGGAARSFASLLLETVIAGLLAPITMLTQTAAVVSILLGRDSGWQAQRRDNGRWRLSGVARLYWPHTVSGVLLGVGALLVSPFLALWMLPVTIGLLFAIPLAQLTALEYRQLRGIGLLATPESLCPPAVLRRAVELREWLDRETWTGGEAVQRLARDRVLLAAHRRMLPAPRKPGLDPIDPNLAVGLAKLSESTGLEEAVRWLTPAEKAAVIGDPDGAERLLKLCSVRTNEPTALREAALHDEKHGPEGRARSH